MGTGFEPAYTALQAAASPLGHPTMITPRRGPERSSERMTGFEPATSTLARWCSSQLSYIRMKIDTKPCRFSVRDTGIEPVTSSVSGKRATAAPIALNTLCSVRFATCLVYQTETGTSKRRSAERTAASRARPGGGDGIRTRVYGFAGRCLASRPPHHDHAEAWSGEVQRADDGIRTRDIHLGKVVL